MTVARSKTSDALEDDSYAGCFMHFRLERKYGRLHEVGRKQGGDWIKRTVNKVMHSLKSG